jgi:hypothetical protein
MDTNRKPGWWLASDGAWYPPEQSPSHGHDAVAGAEEHQAAPHGEPGASAANPPAGWYRDPLISGLRYWDGFIWTEHVAYRRSTPGVGSPYGDDRETTGLTDAVNGRHAPPRRDAGDLELPGWWLTPDSE